MNTPPSVLRDCLRKFLRERFISKDNFAHMMSTSSDKVFSGQTVSNFLSGAFNPHQKTLDAIISVLQDAGALSNMGLPTNLDQEVKPPYVAATDTEILKNMGIEQFKGVEGGNHDMDMSQSSYEKAQLIATIVSSPFLNDNAKRRSLAQIFPDIFRALAVR